MKELAGMGVRQRNYWLLQADAIRRQVVSLIAYGVRIGMAESEDYDKAMKNLELGEEEKKQEGLSPIWNMLMFMRGGHGV